MSAEDFEPFNQLKRERQAKRLNRLLATDDSGWSKFSEHHWYRYLHDNRGFHRLEYWPSRNKWLFQGKYYRGGLPNWLKEKLT